MAIGIPLLFQPLLAHDFWIEPSTYRPAVGSTLTIRLRVGEHFRGDQVPRNDARIERFLIIRGDRESIVTGAEGDARAGTGDIEAPGLHLIVYGSRPVPIQLEARKFEPYLLEEGLEKIVALRAERGESRRPGREVYSRCAKSLVAPREVGTSGQDRAVGLPLELVLGANPYELRSGGEIPIRILFRGEPLPDALVVALNRNQKGEKLSARSDRSGRVVFRLPRKGAWLIKAVHMVAAPAGAPADWQRLLGVHDIRASRLASLFPDDAGLAAVVGRPGMIRVKIAEHEFSNPARGLAETSMFTGLLLSSGQKACAQQNLGKLQESSLSPDTLRKHGLEVVTSSRRIPRVRMACSV